MWFEYTVIESCWVINKDLCDYGLSNTQTLPISYTNPVKLAQNECNAFLKMTGIVSLLLFTMIFQLLFFLHMITAVLPT